MESEWTDGSIQRLTCLLTVYNKKAQINGAKTASSVDDFKVVRGRDSKRPPWYKYFLFSK